MKRFTIFFIAVNAVHVSGGFSAHHQELKTVHTASGICQACLLLPLAVAASCQLSPPKCRYISKKLHSITSQTSVFISKDKAVLKN